MKGHVSSVEDPLVLGIGLAVSFAVSFGAAAVGSRSTMASVTTWYVGLRKPDWVPSGGTIGLVWSVLYVLMAVSANVWNALDVVPGRALKLILHPA